MSDISWTHGLQHARLLCPSLSPGVCSDSCPLSQWFLLTASSSASPFPFCLQSFLASGSFPMSQLFLSGDQSTGVSASVLPVNIQSWFPLGLTDLISLQSKGLSRVFSSTTIRKLDSLVLSFLYGPAIIYVHDYWKSHSFVSKVMSLLFKTVSMFVIAFTPRSECLLILLSQSLSTVILELKKIKSVTVSTFPPSICHEVMELGATILVFFFFPCWVSSWLFHSPLPPSSTGSGVERSRR